MPHGPLTSRLQHVRPGDTVIVGRKPTGTLVIDYLLPGRRLYLLGTGTGLAPFMSIVRDPETYEKFEQVVLVHGVRQVDELAYHDVLVEHLPNHEFLGELVTSKLRYYPTVTRQSYRNMGRITELIESGKLFADLGPAGDRPGARPRDDLRQPGDAARPEAHARAARLQGGQHLDAGRLRDRARVRRAVRQSLVAGKPSGATRTRRRTPRSHLCRRIPS